MRAVPPLAARNPPRRRQTGAALLALVLLVLIVGLGVLFGDLGRGSHSYLREGPTTDALQVAKTALIGYAASYREGHAGQSLGYLPCPDTDNDGSAEMSCGTAGQTMIGRLPWKTLGLPDLRGADGDCLWYAVSGSHKNNPKSAPLNWDSRGSIRVVDATGGALIDGAAAGDTTGGAAATIIAPGSPLPGQNRVGGTTICDGDNTNAIAAYLDGGYAAATAGTLSITAGDPASATNNDRVAWISVAELFAPIARRSDLLADMLGALQTCFNGQATLPLPATAGLKSDNGPSDPKWQVAAAGIDEILATLPAGCAWMANTLHERIWDNWKDHVRYLRCKSGACLNVGSGSCTGALLFGGRHTSGAPRTAAEQTVNGYFENPARLSLNSLATNLDDRPSYAPATPAQDLALCLTASTGGPLLSFANPVTPVFRAALPAPLASFSAGTLTLGAQDVTTDDTGGSFAELFGCAWVGAPIPLANGLRAYFRFRIVRRGPGFTFAMIDANANPSALNVCGSGGRFLGYAGTPTGIDPISPPKIGLEFDTQKTDPDDRNDPDDRHMALVFWGDRAGGPDDDNVHGLSPPAGDPANPPPFSDGDIRDENEFRDVRVELHNNGYASPTGSFRLKAWIVFSDASSPPTNFDNTAVDYAPAPQIDFTFQVGDFGAVRALNSLRLGFTGSTGSTDQVVEITNFKADSR